MPPATQDSRLATRLLRARVTAYLLDIALLFVVLAPAGWLVQRALGITPTTGPEIWKMLLLNFSVPTWIWFTVADASRGGATLGKRWLGIRTRGDGGGRVRPVRAFCRTAVKLLPWELVHVAVFALGVRVGEFSTLQTVGLTLANLLLLGYVVCAVVTRGSRSVHDFATGTAVVYAGRASA